MTLSEIMLLIVLLMITGMNIYTCKMLKEQYVNLWEQLWEWRDFIKKIIKEGVDRASSN